MYDIPFDIVLCVAYRNSLSEIIVSNDDFFTWKTGSLEFLFLLFDGIVWISGYVGNHPSNLKYDDWAISFSSGAADLPLNLVGKQLLTSLTL
jgi:hypothetical protein